MQEAADATLRWRSWPLVDDYPRSLGFVAAFVGACLVVGVAFGGPGYGLLAAALLSVSLARYYLPTTFELDDRGATVRLLGSARKMAWPEVRRAQTRPDGVYLSPFDRPSRLESFRGLFLRYAGNAEKVVSFVGSKVALAS